MRGSRGVLLLTSLHTAEVCAAFVFVNKAWEPKSVYPVPMPHVSITVVLRSNINISLLFILTHTGVLEGLIAAERGNVKSFSGYIVSLTAGAVLQ